MALSTDQVIQFFLESTEYQNIKVDKVNNNLIYYGLSTSTRAGEDEKKWLVFREIQVGGIRCIDYAGTVNSALSTQALNVPDKKWADRATYSYGGVPAGSADPVTSTPSGLTVAGKHTELTIVTGTWTLAPAASLSGRNAMNIQNWATGTDLAVNYSPDILTVAFKGTFITNNGQRQYEVTDSVDVYLRQESGADIVVQIEELS